MLWPKSLNKKIKFNVTLAPHTTFKIGGRARYYFQPSSLKQLQQVLKFSQRFGLHVYILGAGSNILVSDEGVDALVISLKSSCFSRCSVSANTLMAASGLRLNALVAFAKQNNLGGLEFLAGIPGTVGGALVGNVGAWGQAIGELVQQVGVLDPQGKFAIFQGKQLKFTYRKSNLNKYVIIWAKFKLTPQPGSVIAAKIKQLLLLRKKSQGHSLPNAGCVFKNPPGRSAGKLIDGCGLKGCLRGQAMISKTHANFILNQGQAKSQDVLALVGLMQDKVRAKFKVNLKPEIKIWK